MTEKSIPLVPVKSQEPKKKPGKDLISLEYSGIRISFNESGWFNATKAAELFKKRPGDWLKLKETKSYMISLCEFHKVTQNHFIKTKRGKRVGGTWLHPRLAVPFARWCDVNFAIWCDEQIDKIIRGTHPHYDWKRIRHEASGSYKVMSAVLQLMRQNEGKETKFFHYSNEAKLVNWAMTGEYKSIDREALSMDELDLLAKLEERNAVLVGCGLKREDRKLALSQFVSSYGVKQVA